VTEAAKARYIGGAGLLVTLVVLARRANRERES